MYIGSNKMNVNMHNRIETNNMDLSIDKLIQERIFEYFPDLKINKSNIGLSKCKNPEIRINSQIYKYHLVTTKNKILKTMYVKVCESAELEYKTLKYFQKKLALFNEFDVSKPLDFFPGLNAVVTEECSGKNLYRQILKPYSLPILRKYKEEYISKSVFMAGEWLGTFHRLTCKGIVKRIDLDSILYSTEKNLKKCSQIGLDPGTINSIYKEMEVRGFSITNQDLAIARRRYDYRPINIFTSSKKVCVIDFGSESNNHYDFIYYDLCNFIIDLYILSMYPLHSLNFSNSLCLDFLQGYISKGFEISVPALKFFEIVTLVNNYLIFFLFDIFSQSFLKPFKIRVYTYLIKQFIYKKFELMLNQEFGYNGHTI